ATAIRIMVRKSMVIRGGSPTVQRYVAGGFSPVFTVPIRLTRRTRASLKIISATAGASPGREIVASYIIGRARRRPANPGARARNWSGGTRSNANGAVSTFLI